MSKIEFTQVECPQCKSKINAQVYSSVNVVLDPELKPAVIQNALNINQCPKCKFKVGIISDLLYTDNNRNYWVWFRSSLDSKQLLPFDRESESMAQMMISNGIKLRVVTSYNDLVEKIHIFDDELDDRVIEMLKRQIEPDLAGYPGPQSRLLYSRCIKENNMIIVKFSCSQLPGMEITLSEGNLNYLNFKQEYSPFFEPLLGNSNWLLVERKFASDIEKRHNNHKKHDDSGIEKKKNNLMSRFFGKHFKK